MCKTQLKSMAKIVLTRAMTAMRDGHLNNSDYKTRCFISEM
jgi:hypothetical protein